MRFSLGDMIFTRQGRPAVVTGRQDDSQVIVQSGGKKFDKSRTLGFVNGLKPSDRSEYEQTVNRARQEQDPETRISLLQNKVEQLDSEPSKWILKRYLESEMSYIMNSEGIHPQIFQLDEKELL